MKNTKSLIVFSRYLFCAYRQRIPRGFLFLFEELSGDFLFWDLNPKAYFCSLWVQILKRLGSRRDSRFLGFWVSKRGESALLAHDFAWQSLVCYTFCDRGWLKGVGRWRNKHFEMPTEQTDFANLSVRESENLLWAKFGCSGVGGAAQWREFLWEFL